MTESVRPRFIAHLLFALTLGVLILSICGWVNGRHFVEKMLTQLALPCGLIGLALLGLSYLALRLDRLRLGIPLAIVSLFYWMAGSWYTGEWIATWYERPFRHVDISGVEPFDYLIVLGGGLRSNQQGDVWLNSSGDRVVLAARLYHQGKAKRLIATGEGFAWSGGAGFSRARVWLDLGIPEEAIIEVGGRNTAEEMDNLRRLLGDLPDGRVGLLTSAFHLSRALRLARAHGLSVEPVPADFKTGALDPMPLSLIPSRKGFHRTEICMREFLASLVGR